MSLSRREFVVGAVTAGAGMTLGGLPSLILQNAAEASTGGGAAAAGNSPAVLYDLTRCLGCHFCEVACQKNKGLPDDTALIKFRKPYPDVAPGEAWAVRRSQCMHCINPACVAACPVAAMYKTPEGPVIYRDKRCLGCRYCMNACPFGVPTFDWNAGILDGALIHKCDFCADRQAQGKKPACIEACPSKAVIFGKRDELLAEAHTRIAEHPEKYVDHVYGEFEAGGTSFLLLSEIPFDKLGLPQPGNKSLPETSTKVMKGTIPFALTWFTVLSGFTAAVRWRDNRMHGEHQGGKEDGK